MGWIDNEMSGCHSSNVPFGPDGFLLNGVLGVGGPSYGMEVLCLSSDGEPAAVETCRCGSLLLWVCCGRGVHISSKLCLTE